MGDPVSMLQEMDARARQVARNTARALRSLKRSGWTLYHPDGSRRDWVLDEVQIIRAASRERIRIRHALAALRTPARALAALRVV